MTLSHLIYRIAHSYPGSIARLADEMGKGMQVLSNKLNPNSDSHQLTIGELETIADFTDSNLQIAGYFSNKANAVLVPLPTEIIQGDMGLLDAFLEIGHKSGTFDYEFKLAWGDGRIDAAEFERLKQANLALIGARLALMAELERVVR